MSSTVLRRLLSLDLEEQILNISALGAIIGVLLPWVGGEFLGRDDATYNGFGFFTAFIGVAIFVVQLCVLLITLIPILGGPVVIRKQHREMVRLSLTGSSAILVLSALSVLAKITLEFSRMEIRFGIYVTLICSLVGTLYSFLRTQEQKRSQVHELFHHPENPVIERERETGRIPPPPPPPPPPSAPEEHRLMP